MEMNIVSVKQLRENFGQIKEGIENGLSYLLIYRSQPLAEIRPVDKGKESPLSKEERIKRDVAKVEKLAGGLNLGRGLTPEEINRMIDAEYEKDFRKMLS